MINTGKLIGWTITAECILTQTNHFFTQCRIKSNLMVYFVII